MLSEEHKVGFSVGFPSFATDADTPEHSVLENVSCRDLHILRAPYLCVSGCACPQSTAVCRDSGSLKGDSTGHA